MDNINTYRSLLADLNYSNELLMISMACRHYEEMDNCSRQLLDEEQDINETMRMNYQQSASRLARSMTEILFHIHALILKLPYSSSDVQVVDSMIGTLKGKASKEHIDNAIHLSMNLVKKYRLNEVKQRHQLYMTSLSTSPN